MCYVCEGPHKDRRMCVRWRLGVYFWSRIVQILVNAPHRSVCVFPRGGDSSGEAKLFPDVIRPAETERGRAGDPRFTWKLKAHFLPSSDNLNMKTDQWTELNLSHL